MSDLRPVEVEIENAQRILSAMAQDLDLLEAASKKLGVRAQRAIKDIADRRLVAQQCLVDALALLPPAPDGATEGWRLVPVEPHTAAIQRIFNTLMGEPDIPEGTGGWWGTSDQYELACDIYRAAVGPSVSPVGPKGEEQWLEEAAEITPKAWVALGEENAGLVEEAEYWLTEPVNVGGMHDALADASDLIRRLADALASRSPIPGEDRTRAENAQVGELKAGVREAVARTIALGMVDDLVPTHVADQVVALLSGPLQNQLTSIPGELKALSDAAPPGPWRAGDITMAGERYIIANDAVVATRASVDSAAFIVACANHVRQALAKTHQVAEGGVASAADSA